MMHMTLLTVGKEENRCRNSHVVAKIQQCCIRA